MENNGINNKQFDLACKLFIPLMELDHDDRITVDLLWEADRLVTTIKFQEFSKSYIDQAHLDFEEPLKGPDFMNYFGNISAIIEDINKITEDRVTFDPIKIVEEE